MNLLFNKKSDREPAAWGSSIYLLDANRDYAIRQLADHTNKLRLGSTFAWAPNSEMLAFTHIVNSKSRIEMVRLNGSRSDRQEFLKNYGESHSAPTWSPDSKQVAFVSKGQICVATITGSDFKCISPVPDSNATPEPTPDIGGNPYDSNPEWSPDGEYITYLHRSDRWRLYRIAPDGSDNRFLTDQTTDSVPQWGT
jgi:Tol biopolymer transport system component